MSHLSFKPLTSANWDDFEALFGSAGGYGGCWCMWWRLKRKEFEQNQGEGNRQAMKSLVDAGTVPGIIAYADDQPCGWCSVAPRDDFPSLNRSPVLKRLDNLDVWSITCFFIARPYRGQQLSAKLIYAAIDFVRQQGGLIIEAYPSILKGDKAAPVSSFMGIPRVYERCGFTEVVQPSARKLMMRLSLED